MLMSIPHDALPEYPPSTARVGSGIDRVVVIKSAVTEAFIIAVIVGAGREAASDNRSAVVSDDPVIVALGNDPVRFTRSAVVDTFCIPVTVGSGKLEANTTASGTTETKRVVVMVGAGIDSVAVTTSALVDTF